MGSAVSHVDEVQGRLGLRAGHSSLSQRVFRPTDSRAIKGKMVGCVPKAKGKGHGRHKENRETTFYLPLSERADHSSPSRMVP